MAMVEWISLVAALLIIAVLGYVDEARKGVDVIEKEPAFVWDEDWRPVGRDEVLTWSTFPKAVVPVFEMPPATVGELEPVRIVAVTPYAPGVKPTAFLFYVQDPDGYEIVATTYDVAKVSEVTARIITHIERGRVVGIFHNETMIASGATGEPADRLKLYRVPAADKTAKPTTRAVKEMNA